MITAIETIISDTLIAHGWSLWAGNNTNVAATKSFTSCVGHKDATAYLLNIVKPYDYVLSGDYMSKGTNILTTCSVTIPKDSTPDAVAELSRLFVENVELKIADSYAVRLFKLGVMPKEPSPKTNDPRCLPLALPL